MGMAGFKERQVHMDDPVVCGACAATVGTQGGLRTDEARKSAQAGHAPDCRRRQAHMMRHRALPGPCPDCVR